MNGYSENVVEGALDSFEQYYSFIRELKETNRHLLTNFYIDEERFAEEVSKKKIQYFYKKNICLNLLMDEWDYSRLYYYIADATKYVSPSTSKRIVADVFGKSNKKDNTAIAVFRNDGFYDYACFSKYSKKCDDNNMFIDSENIRSGAKDGFYDAIKKCFDIYTDFVPQKKIEEFFDNHFCYSYIDENGGLAGGSVLSVKGTVATEEFVFVLPEYRGNKISNALREYGYNNVNNYSDKNITKFISWVNDKNVASIKYLIRNGYKKESVYKITMMKG